jgi:hypothetical protein
MTEKIHFCKRCVHREMDIKRGVLCGMTREKPTFEQECSDYEEDSAYRETALPESTYDRNFLGFDRAEEPDEKLPVEMHPAAFEEAMKKQDLLTGILMGGVVGILCAVLWALLTVATMRHFGIAAMGMGAAVGLTIRYIGKGVTPVFGIAGAVIALLGCVLGNFLALVSLLADEVGMGYFKALFQFDYSYLPTLMRETFQTTDLYFYGVAVVEAYIFSFRKAAVKS